MSFENMFGHFNPEKEPSAESGGATMMGAKGPTCPKCGKEIREGSLEEHLRICPANKVEEEDEPHDVPVPEIGDFPKQEASPEKDPDIEAQKGEILKRIVQNGETTEKQLEDWFEDIPPKKLKELIVELENEEKIKTSMTPDGMEYYVSVE